MAAGSVQVVLPVGGDPAGWPGNRLVQRVVFGRGEGRTAAVVVGAVVPEPVLTRLEAADDRVAGGSCMGAGVLAGRIVAAADMATLGTAAKVEPPAVGREAFNASGAARRDARVDHNVSHGSSSLLVPSVRP